ncbi:MAG: cobalt ECF transporter T component CbiQ [Micrococcales bacterium]|nr:cobalt ECF transporter T component CbiQ [Micrococcales bacterium]
MTQGGLALDAAAWSSVWRGRAVRDKAVLSLGLVGLALLLPAWPGTVVVGLAAVVLLLGPARVPAGLLARCLAGPLAFIAIGAASVLVSVTWEGRPVARVTPQGVAAAGSLFGHGVAGTLSMLVLATTTPMVDLFSAMRRARIPDACIEVASLIYRLLFVLLDSTRTIAEAQHARLGYVTRRAAMRSSAALTGAVLLRSWERARRLEEGLSGRGYTTSLRTLDPPLRASGPFLAMSVVGLGTLAAGTALLSGMVL